jgi:hypothetical protein
LIDSACKDMGGSDENIVRITANCQKPIVGILLHID